MRGRENGSNKEKLISPKNDEGSRLHPFPISIHLRLTTMTLMVVVVLLGFVAPTVREKATTNRSSWTTTSTSTTKHNKPRPTTGRVVLPSAPPSWRAKRMDCRPTPSSQSIQTPRVLPLRNDAIPTNSFYQSLRKRPTRARQGTSPQQTTR